MFFIKTIQLYQNISIKLKTKIILRVDGEKLVHKLKIYRYKFKPDNLVKYAVN